MGTQADELRADIARTRQEMSMAIGEIEHRASPRQIIERRKQSMRERMSSARERVMGVAEESQARMSSTAHTAADEVKRAPQAIRHEAQGNPLAAGLVAFGGGLLLATVLPASKQEQKLAESVQPEVEGLKQHLGEEARHMGEQLKPKAQQAAHHVKDEASAAADHVKTDAQSAAEDVKSEAKHRADDVKHDAKSSAERTKRQL